MPRCASSTASTADFAENPAYMPLRSPPTPKMTSIVPDDCRLAILNAFLV